LYEKSASRILAKGETPEYNHTLSTVWVMSLEKLTPEAEQLLSLLAFFDGCLEFLLDDFEYAVLQ
jgi:hypothetical protein